MRTEQQPGGKRTDTEQNRSQKSKTTKENNVPRRQHSQIHSASAVTLQRVRLVGTQPKAYRGSREIMSIKYCDISSKRDRRASTEDECTLARDFFLFGEGHGESQSRPIGKSHARVRADGGVQKESYPLISSPLRVLLLRLLVGESDVVVVSAFIVV